MKNIAYLLVNFGGPRSVDEIASFLKALLTDQDVVRTKLPAKVHKLLFSYVANKRAPKVAPDYLKIGGKSPIYEDTESIAEKLQSYLDAPIIPFHRYLPKTHPSFFSQVQALDAEEIRVFPLFPQFSYATSGSIARFFAKHLPKQLVNRMRWIKSYPASEGYIRSFQQLIKDYIQEQNLTEEQTTLLFSAHGLPQKFVETGEVYQSECETTFRKLQKCFPKCSSILSYQSKFGRGEWLKPYTEDLCNQVTDWNQGRKNVVFVPLSFTSDHIETLFEVEYLYLPIIREKGFHACRCPALNQREEWIKTIADMMQSENHLCSNQMLIFSNRK